MVSETIADEVVEGCEAVEVSVLQTPAASFSHVVDFVTSSVVGVRVETVESLHSPLPSFSQVYEEDDVVDSVVIFDSDVEPVVLVEGLDLEVDELVDDELVESLLQSPFASF